MTTSKPTIIERFIAEIDEEIARLKTEIDRLDGLKVEYDQLLRARLALINGEVPEPTFAAATAPAQEVGEATPAPFVHPSTRRKGKPVLRLAPQRTPEELEVEMRDWVVAQGDREFTNVDLAKGIRIKSSTYAGKKIQPLIDQGVVIVLSGPSGNKRRAFRYKYAGKPVPHSTRLTQVPNLPDSNVGSVPIPGTGKTTLSNYFQKDVANLLDKVKGQVDIAILDGGHRKVTSRKTGQSITVAATPGNRHTATYVKADLRRIGVNVA